MSDIDDAIRDMNPATAVAFLFRIADRVPQDERRHYIVCVNALWNAYVKPRVPFIEWIVPAVAAAVGGYVGALLIGSH